MHAVGSLGLLKISIDWNTIVVFFIWVSAHQLPNVLVYLRWACWHILIARVDTAKLIGERSHFLILGVLLCNLQALGCLLAIIQIVGIWPFSIFLIRIHIHACFIHAREISDLGVVLGAILYILVATSLIKEWLRVQVVLILVHWLWSRVTRLSLVLPTAWWHPVLGIVGLRCIVVGVQTRCHVDLHYVTNIPFRLAISVFHGVHECFDVFLICRIWWQQLEFIVHNILMGI